MEKWMVSVAIQTIAYIAGMAYWQGKNKSKLEEAHKLANNALDKVEKLEDENSNLTTKLDNIASSIKHSEDNFKNAIAHLESNFNKAIKDEIPKLIELELLKDKLEEAKKGKK